jgi:hypothetical protein
MRSHTGSHLAVSKLPRFFLIDLHKKISPKKVPLSISKSVDIFSKVFKGFLGVFLSFMDEIQNRISWHG